jgi:hypothetical protein
LTGFYASRKPTTTFFLSDEPLFPNAIREE